jgi:hypothetical protein
MCSSNTDPPFVSVTVSWCPAVLSMVLRRSTPSSSTVASMLRCPPREPLFSRGPSLNSYSTSLARLS